MQNLDLPGGKRRILDLPRLIFAKVASGWPKHILAVQHLKAVQSRLGDR